MRLALATFVCLVLMPVAIVHAQSRVRVSVDDFTGPGAAGARRSVVSALEDDARVEVVGAGGDVVLAGAVGGRGRRRFVTITARDARGAEIGHRRARVASASAIEQAVAALVDAATQRAPASTPSDTAVATTTTTPSPTETRLAHATAPPPPASSSFGAPVPLLVLAAGAVLRSRETNVDVAGGMTRTYHASPFVELYARVEARPLGADPSYARGLYLWGDIGYAVGLSSQLPDRTQVSTTFLRMSAHAGYLIPLASFLEVGASFGVGWERYDLGANVVLPTIDYPYLRPAVRARFRIVDELFVIGVEAGYRALLSREGLSTSFGTNGDSFGYDLAASVSGSLDFGLFYGVEAGWAQFVHAFGGTAAIAPGTGGTDGGYRVALTLGYALR
jgi:hypothetical protein